MKVTVVLVARLDERNKRISVSFGDCQHEQEAIYVEMRLLRLSVPIYN
jgi:hypothetical protein